MVQIVRIAPRRPKPTATPAAWATPQSSPGVTYICGRYMRTRPLRVDLAAQDHQLDDRFPGLGATRAAQPEGRGRNGGGGGPVGCRPRRRLPARGDVRP